MREILNKNKKKKDARQVWVYFTPFAVHYDKIRMRETATNNL